MGELGGNRNLCYECVVAHIYYINPLFVSTAR